MTGDIWRCYHQQIILVSFVFLKYYPVCPKKKKKIIILFYHQIFKILFKEKNKTKQRAPIFELENLDFSPTLPLPT